MEVVKITPRGYCYGVVDAMVIARQAANDDSLPRPIYILGMIVHNKHVTDAFEEEGIISLDGPNRLEILKNVENGTVIFTAHGVSPEVRRLADEKGLTTIDATCQMLRLRMTSFLIRRVKAMTSCMSENAGIQNQKVQLVSLPSTYTSLKHWKMLKL